MDMLLFWVKSWILSDTKIKILPSKAEKNGKFCCRRDMFMLSCRERDDTIDVLNQPEEDG